mgnify:CR=1 FL=1
MAYWNDPRPRQWGLGGPAGPLSIVAAPGRVGTYDAGLRRYMLSIYNYMASGVLLSGIVALLFTRSGYAAQAMTGGPLSWLIILSPLAFVVAMSFGANRMHTATVQALFWGFCIVMGLSLSALLLVFTGASIAAAFFAAAGAFAGLSLVGYTTKKDLSGMGTFLIMGVIGLIVAMLVNMFMQSTSLHLAISFLGVLIFAGLTAYDTQRLKARYGELWHSAFMGKSVVLGALTLYLDLINIFQFLLSFMGQQRD